jgi:hypothetical protein
MPDLPQARRHDVHTEQLKDELLVYDETRDTAHSLNRTAAAVWRASDGTRTTDDLVRVLADELGDLADEDLVLVTLDDLRAAELIEGAPKRDPEVARLSRRRFIRRVGAVGTAALALPVVHSIVAPDPAAAGTTPTSPSTSTPTSSPSTSPSTSTFSSPSSPSSP